METETEALFCSLISVYECTSVWAAPPSQIINRGVLIKVSTAAPLGATYKLDRLKATYIVPRAGVASGLAKSITKTGIKR